MSEMQPTYRAKWYILYEHG